MDDGLSGCNFGLGIRIWKWGAEGAVRRFGIKELGFGFR